MGIKTFYDLTNPQKSIWLTEQFYKGTTLGNVSGTLTIKETVNFDLLEKALNKFVERNDSLRLKIIVDKGTPKQFVEEYSYVDIPKFEIDFNDISSLENDIVSEPFELIDSFLYKFSIIKYPDGTGGFNANLHHLISDAWTMSILINQVMDIYEKLLENEPIDMTAPSYIDYIQSETEYKTGEKFQKDQEFWEGTFKSLPDLAKITPYEVKEESFSSCRKDFSLDNNLSERINTFCKDFKVSPYSLFMSVYSIYLSRVSNIDDVVIGTPMLNRSNFKEKNTTGMFISSLPNKIDINHEDKFIDFVKNVSTTQMSVFRHQKYPYDLLLSSLREKNGISRGLYDVLLSYQNARNNSKDSKINYVTNWLFSKDISNSLDIHIYDMDNTGELKIFYDYQTCKFTQQEINEIHSRILNILGQVISEPNMVLNTIEIVTPEEKQKLLYDFNDTKVDYPKNTTISGLFEEQVKKTPDNIALVFEDKNLTFKELNEKSNQLANFLRKNNVKGNTIVGIMVERSLEMLVRYNGYS